MCDVCDVCDVIFEIYQTDGHLTDVSPAFSAGHVTRRSFVRFFARKPASFYDVLRCFAKVLRWFYGHSAGERPEHSTKKQAMRGYPILPVLIGGGWRGLLSIMQI
jgi:hypothetical protein